MRRMIHLSLLAMAALLPLAVQAQSTLVITSDAPCTLNVNGAAKGQLAADEPKAVEVKPGQQLVLCRGASNPPRQNSCRPDRSLTRGREERGSGSIRTSVQGQGGGAVVAT